MRSQSKAPQLPPHRLCFPDFSLERTVNVTNLHSGTELDLSADDRHHFTCQCNTTSRSKDLNPGHKRIDFKNTGLASAKINGHDDGASGYVKLMSQVAGGDENGEHHPVHRRRE